jgi:ABC-type Fe3+/spermidine/putrescine transport system ATPase subunit
VADFLGNANVLPVEVIGSAGDGRTEIRVGGQVLACRGIAAPGDDVRLVIRPERLMLEAPDNDAAAIDGTIARIVYQGPTTDIIVRLPGDEELVVRRPSEHAGHHIAGEQVTVHCSADAMRLLPPGALTS